jgi:hypothetical protein
MGGIPNPFIYSLWNIANVLIETGWSEEQYYKTSKKTTQAIIAILEARARKQKQESQRNIHG